MNCKNTFGFRKIIMISGAVAFLLGILNGCLLLSYYHADTGYTDGKLPAILSAAAFALILLLGAYTAYAAKERSAEVLSAAEKEDSLAERIVRGVLAAGLLAILIGWLFGDPFDPLKTISAREPKLLFYSARASVILAAIAGVSMLLFAILQPKNRNVRFLLYLPLSLFTLAYVLRRYLDTRILLTDYRRMLSILAIAMFSLFLVGEMRLLTGRFSAFYYALTGFGALGALSLSGIGSIVLHLGNGASDGLQFAFVVTEAIAAVFTGVRLFRVFGDLSCPPPQPDVAVGDNEIGEDETRE